jgi:hypothetical protein
MLKANLIRKYSGRIKKRLLIAIYSLPNLSFPDTSEVSSLQPFSLLVSLLMSLRFSLWP